MIEKANIDLNRMGVVTANSLIASGNVDRESSWSFDAADGNAILGDPPDWEKYGFWHLGTTPDDDAESKAHWHYPFGKGGKLYRSGLIAIRSRAGQQDDTEVFDMAGRMIEVIDEGEGKGKGETMKSEVQKAAEAHRALLIEKINAIKKIADELSGDMDLKDLQAKVSALKGIMWRIDEDAEVVNITKRDPADIEKAHDAAEALVKKIKDGITDDVVAGANALTEAVTTMVEKATGAGGGTQQAGPGGRCVCISCGKKVNHKQAQACTDMKCPSCGAAMVREGYEPKKGDDEVTKKLDDILKQLGAITESLASATTEKKTEWPDDLSRELENE